MFAIIADGGRQYRVSQGDLLSVDYRADVNEGDSITFDMVLLANGGGASVIGRPAIEGASVSATVVYPMEKGEKLEIQKLRRRKNSRRHTGHRQKYTAVEIGEIQVPGLEIVEQPKSEEPAAKTESAPSTPSETGEKSDE